MTLGEKIYRLRMERGLSQEAFGEMLNVSRQSVSKWETDQSFPELDKIVAISEMFGVSTDYLLKESEEWMANGVNMSDSPRTDTDFEKNGHTQQVIVHRQTFEYEYKSQKSWRGLPLVHVHIGIRPVRAKGVIAIGNIAQGVIAIGIVGMGVITFAVVGLGLFLAIGSIVMGGIALGSLAVGIIAMGALCVGVFTMGAVAVGQFSYGALAVGSQIAIGDVARGGIALGDSEARGVFFEAVRTADGSFDYEGMIRAIDANVPGYWHVFAQWMKAIIRILAGVR